MISDGTFLSKERLKKTKDFRRAYKDGACFRKSNLILYCLSNNLIVNRFGFVVSARTVKRANRRNRIKRLLREAVRSLKSGLKNGFDVVVVVKKAPEPTLSLKSVLGSLRELINEARLIR